MKRLSIALLIGGLLLTLPAGATVIIVTVPTSLVPVPKTVPASSGPIGLFEFGLRDDTGGSLTSVSVAINKTASSTLVGSDLASLAVYRDSGNGVFDSSTDLLAGSQSSINVNATTSIPVTTNNVLVSSTTKFFVAAATGATWNDSAPRDEFFAQMPAHSIVTSSISPTTTSVSTALISADTSAPRLLSAVAKNTGGTSAKEAGDSIELTFSEATNKPTIASSTVALMFSVSGGHSFLDSTNMLGAASWNSAGTVLTITLIGSTSTIPTIATGDAITVVTPSAIIDAAGNKATGAVVLTGSFGQKKHDDDKDKKDKKICANGLINGRLYRVQGSDTIYLAAHCNLKIFKGKAVGKAHGKKFKNIITLSSLEGLTVQTKKPHDDDDDRDEEKEERTAEKIGKKIEKIQEKIEELKEKLQEKIEKLQEKLNELRSKKEKNR